MMLFEGFGVGLLVPLLNLLLGGERATPMRPLQWLERTLPGHSPAFYIGAIAVAIVLSVALKNVAFYTSLVLAARLKRRIAVKLRDDLFRRLHRADLDLFDRLPGGDLANVFLVETYRTTVAIDAMLALIQRTSIAFFYVAALFFLSWPLTTLVVVLAVGARQRAVVRLRASEDGRRGADRSQPPHGGHARAVVLRRPHRAGDALPGSRDRAVSRAERGPGRRRGAQRRGALAALSDHRDAGRGRRDGDRHLRLHLPRAPRLHAEQLPARVRLRPAAAAPAAQSALRTARPPRLSRRAASTK